MSGRPSLFTSDDCAAFLGDCFAPGLPGLPKRTELTLMVVASNASLPRTATDMRLLTPLQSQVLGKLPGLMSISTLVMGVPAMVIVASLELIASAKRSKQVPGPEVHTPLASRSGSGIPA